jgi:hypothetical protein
MIDNKEAVEIVSFSIVTTEGITLEFKFPFALNGGIKVNEWYLSWEKLSDMISVALKHRDELYQLHYSNKDKSEANSQKKVGK